MQLAFGRSARAADLGEDNREGADVDDHEADHCRCNDVDCSHVTQLHIALLAAAGYSEANADNWQAHFSSELSARREDWPTIEAALQADDVADGDDDEKSERPAQPKKKKRKVARVDPADDGHPLLHRHYHALSPRAKCALLYLHTQWMLLDAAVHELISEAQMRDVEPYGHDDDGNRYFLYRQRTLSAAPSYSALSSSMHPCRSQQ